MRRKVFNFAAGASLVLSLTTALLWLRSQNHRDDWFYYGPGPTYAVASVAGRIVIDNSPELQRYWREQDRELSALLGEPLTPRVVKIPPQKWNAFRLINNRTSPAFVARTVLHDWMILVITAVMPLTVFIRYLRREIRVYSEQLRAKARLCPACRYDLTGNVSGVCPECGTAVGENVGVKA